MHIPAEEALTFPEPEGGRNTGGTMDFITIGEMVIDFIPGQEEASYVRNAGGAPTM